MMACTFFTPMESGLKEKGNKKMLKIRCNADISDKEKMQYVEYLEKEHGRKVEELDINVDGDFVDLNYKFEPVRFERIRRITGYLVGTLDNWNDAKKAEEADRVKHGVSGEMEELR